MSIYFLTQTTINCFFIIDIVLIFLVNVNVNVNVALYYMFFISIVSIFYICFYVRKKVNVLKKFVYMVKKYIGRLIWFQLDGFKCPKFA